MNSKLTLLYSASLHISNPQIYELYRYDDERKMFIYQNLNGSKSLSQHYELALQYDIIPQIFSLRPVLIYDHMDVSLWKDFSFDRFFFCCSLFYMHNGWSFDVNYMAPSKYMKITSGLILPECWDSELVIVSTTGILIYICEHRTRQSLKGTFSKLAMKEDMKVEYLASAIM